MSGPERKILKPKDYEKMISSLDIENFELKTSSILEARITLVSLERLAEDLLEIRREVSGDMRAIKLKYLGHDHTKSSLIGSLRGTKASTRRKSLNDKCDRELGPYKNVLYIIDHYIEQIEEVKKDINEIKA